MNYKSIWAQVKDLPWCVLVTTGRTGTDFFQSLLDSHPEIFVFNGRLYFHNFWEAAWSTKTNKPLILADVLEEFVGTHIQTLKSHYEPSERKDQLGENLDQSIDIDVEEFKAHVTALLEDQSVTAKNMIIAIYVAYDLCLNRDIQSKKLFIHHVHHIRKVDSFMIDFPDSKIICMTRDPRALYVSGVENWRRYEAKTDNPSYPLYILWRSVDECLPLAKYDDGRLGLLKLESLAEEKTLHTTCNWLGISFDLCLKDSTWGGMRWWGDKISQNQIPENERGFSRTMSTNKWEEKLNRLDKEILNYLLIDVLEHYGYSCRRQNGILFAAMMAVAILVPTGYEQRFLSFKYLLGALREINPKKFIAAFYHPMRRVLWFYKLFIRRNFGNFQTFPLISSTVSDIKSTFS